VTVRGWAVAIALVGLVALPATAAQLDVGAGSSLILGSAGLNLACADLVVGGTLKAGDGTGIDGVRDLTIQPTGNLDGESTTIRVAGDWSNGGSFAPGTGAVAFEDGCARSTATVSDSTVFSTLEMSTATGRTWFFESGATFGVLDLLSLEGAEGALLAIRSTIGGTEAFIDLGGAHLASFVDVADNHAVGSPITLGAGSLVSGNAPGWTVSGLIPALPTLGLVVLGAGLFLLLRLRLHRG